MKKYFKVLKVLLRRNYAEMTQTKLDALGFVLAKLTRIAFLLIFLIAVFRHAGSLAGYSIEEILLFYLLFNIIDTLTQAIYRGVYHMPPLIARGDFDFFLTKPVNPVFLSLLWVIDFFDVLTFIPIVGALIYLFVKFDFIFSGLAVFQGFVVLVLSFTLITALHILALALMVRFVASDSVIWVYRDLNVLGRFPPEIYARTFRFALTFVLPIFIMMSYPAKAILGLLSWPSIALAAMITLLFLRSSVFFWKNTLKNYQSASS